MGQKDYASVSAAAAMLALLLQCRADASGRGPASPCQTAPGIIAGRVTHVRDGDTIVVEGVPVRLQGVAAPELHEPLGREAGRFMRELVADREVSCEPDGTRSHDRVVAVCRLEGRDIGAVIVSQGLARDCRRYSRGRYAPIEASAARQKGTHIAELYPLPHYCRPG